MSEIISGNAYMLVYRQRGWEEEPEAATIASSADPAVLPADLQAKVAASLASFRQSCAEYESRKAAEQEKARRGPVLFSSVVIAVHCARICKWCMKRSQLALLLLVVGSNAPGRLTRCTRPAHSLSTDFVRAVIGIGKCADGIGKCALPWHCNR